MKTDPEAQLIAKNDAKFLAKLTGSSWCLKQTGSGSSSRSSSPAGQLQSTSSGRQSPAQALKTRSGSAAAAALSVQSRASPTPVGLQPSGSRHSGPGSTLSTQASTSTASQQRPSADARSSSASDSLAQVQAAAAAGQQQAQQLFQQEQQETYSSPHSSKAARESPQWLLETAANPAKAEHAATRAQHGPIHAESSLYAAWATAQPVDSSTCRASTASPVLTRSQPVSPFPAASSSLPHGCAEQGLPAGESAACCPANRASTRRCTSPLRQATPAAGPDAAVCTAAEAAAVLPGSPCGSNYHSTRAAAMAAGISRAGAVSPEHHEWYRREHPGAQPPRREDTQQLWQWLQEELQQLKQQLQPPFQEPQQQQQQPGNKAKEQQQLSSPAMGRAASPVVRAPAAAGSCVSATSSSNPACGTSSRSGSPVLRARDRSPGRVTPSADRAGQCVTGSAAVPLEQQAQQLTAMCKELDGKLQDEGLQLQRELYSAAFHEVCRQVSVGCVERGALMTQLWSAHTVLLQAALQDGHTAQQQRAAAEQATAAALKEQQRLRQLEEDEKVALRAFNDRHATKAEAARQDYEQLKMQHEKLQELLKKLSGAQQLVQRVMDLEASNQQQATSIQQLQAQLANKQEQLELTSMQLMHWQGRAQAAEAQVAQQAQQLGVSTPRPKRDLGLLCDLVEQPLQQLIEQALVEGTPAAHVHRLLLGLSTTGQDMRPWLELAGSCVPALHRSSDPARLYQLLQQHLTECNGAALSKHLGSPDHLQLLSTAVHIGTDSDTLLSLLVGSLGLPAASQAPAGAAAAGLGTCGIPTQQQQRASVLAAGAAPADASPTAVWASLGVGIGLQLLPLVGVLASKYGHDARELGGPVTEALVQAQLSTVARVQEMEARCRSLHREVVMLKCTLAEQRKHEQERVEAALRDQKRKIARREARQPTLLEKFLQTKWGTLFSGIGMSEDLPRVLRANVPVNNKQMPKREAERLASEIWSFKDEADAAAASPITLAEATAVFLERRFFAIPRLVTEVAYNLIYSLAQHTYDTDCNLFLRVFSGEVDETVRHEQQLLEGEIMRMLKLLDMSINHQATGWLHKADVKTALAGFFKGKKVDRLAEVLEALDTDEPGEALHYANLFSDDDDLNQGLTAEIIRSQHLTERLEFLQEIEDYIRDAAEDNGTTSLTPAMLEGCLRKAHKRLDSAAVSEYVSRAFGPDWEDNRNRLAQPLGAIIRAVRCGGLPNMVRAAAGPSNMAGAIDRIVPVGTFKKKLVTALKVGFSKDAAGVPVAAGTAAAAVAAGKAKSRRATQETVNAVIAAVLSGDGSKPKSRLAGKPAAGDAAAAAAAADSGGTDSSSAAAEADNDASETAASTQDDGQAPAQAGSAAATPPVLSAAGSRSSSRPGTANTGSRSISPPKLLIPDSSAASTPQVLSPAFNGVALTPSAAAGAAAALAARASAAGALKNSAVARALTVDVLSAMEAVRQSWLKEEGDKMMSLSGSGAAAAGAAAWPAGNSCGGVSAAAAAGEGIRFSMPHQQSAAAAGFLLDVDPRQAGPGFYGTGMSAAAAGGSTSGSGSGRPYDMPAVPALRLSEVGLLGAAAAAGSSSSLSLGDGSTGGSSPSRGTGSVSGTYRSSCASSAQCTGRSSSFSSSLAGGGAVGSASGQQQHQQAVKPILMNNPETPKRAKHVQIHTEDNTVFAFPAAAEDREASSPNPGTSLGQQQQQQQQQQALGLPATAAGVFLSPKGFSRQESGQARQQVQFESGATTAAAAAGAGGPGAVSRSSSGSNRRPGTSSGIGQLGHVASSSSRAASSPRTQASKQPQGRVGSGEGGDGSGSSERSSAPSLMKRRSSKSSKLAALLPQLMLTDADEACAAEQATPGAGGDEHSQVCFTPQAPEKGGKRNAILMRRLNKGRSLKHLEDMMLAVAEGEME